MGILGIIAALAIAVGGAQSALVAGQETAVTVARTTTEQQHSAPDARQLAAAPAPGIDLSQL